MKRLFIFLIFTISLSLFATNLAIVIAPGDFQKRELIPVKETLEKNKISYKIFSTRRGSFWDMSKKYKENVSNTIKDLKVKNFDGIIIIGGTGTKKYLWNNRLLQNKVIEFNKEKKLIAAICFGPIVLVKAGLLKGMAATSYKTLETLKIFKNNGAIYYNKGVIKNKNIITSNGPRNAVNFAKAIVLYFK